MTVSITSHDAGSASSPWPRPPAAGLSVVFPEDWDGLMDRLAALETYTCAAYSRASALLEPEGTRPLLLHFRNGCGELALPLLLRPLPDGGWDATSAYGYGGPVARGQADLAAFGAAFDAWARENGVVTTFLRLDPLRDNGRWVPPTAELIDAGRTVLWDVSAGRDLWAALHSDHRRNIRKADAAGVVTTIVRRPESLEPFRDLYYATMTRLGASPFFHFPPAYWDALRAHDDVLVPVLVEGRLEGRLVTGLLCLESPHGLHAHLSAGDEAARSIGASSRCYLAAGEWAQQQGLGWVHLGGGLGASTSSTLYRFKRSIDRFGEPRVFQVAKIVHDRDRYRSLAGTDSTAGYFPPWRRPR